MLGSTGYAQALLFHKETGGLQVYRELSVDI